MITIEIGNLGLAFAVLALIFSAMAMGALMNRDDMRKEAVQHNAAVWVADPITGDKVFKWKDEVVK